MALSVLCGLLQRYRCTASRDEYPYSEELTTLSRMGLVDTTGLSSTVICNVCDEDHPAQIVADPTTDELGWYCPDYGFVSSPKSERRAIRALPGRLTELIADALDCNRRLERPLIEGLLWRIGALEIANNDVTMFLALRLRDANDARNIGMAISAESGMRNGLILTPKFSGSPVLNIAKCRIAALDEFISIEDEKIATSEQRAADLAGIQVKSRAGAPKHNNHEQAKELIMNRYLNGSAKQSARDEARAVTALLGKLAPGDRTLRSMIRAVRTGQ